MKNSSSFLKKNIFRLKSGDEVLIIVGKNKGKKGKIQEINKKKSKVKFFNLNLIKKFKKPTEHGKKGKIIEFPAYMDISNVMIFCSVCKKGVRIRIDRNKDKKIRMCSKCYSKFDN